MADGPATPGDTTSAKLLNQSVSGLITAIGQQGGDLISALADIAAAITASIIGGTTGSNANRLLRAKGTTGRALQPSPVTCDDSGNLTGIADVTGSGTAAFATVSATTVNATNVNGTNGAFTTTLTKGGSNLAVVLQTVCASFTFKAPEDETVALILNSQFAWTITQTDTITEVGTATVTVKIGTTALGGSANSASTSLDTQAHSSDNVVSTSNQINVTFSSTSGDCENLCLTIWGTRVLTS